MGRRRLGWYADCSAMMFSMLVIFMLFLACYPVTVSAGLNRCCPSTQSQECRVACKKLAVPPPIISDYKAYFTLVYLNRKLTTIVDKCPQSESKFWECLRTTQLMRDFRKQTVRQKSKRYHGVCCKEAKHTSCEVDCLTTKNIAKLLQKESCDANREPNFSKCIKKVHDAKKCCGGHKKGCKHACMQYFKNIRSENVLAKKQELEKKCGKESKQYKCALGQSKFDTAMQDFTQCCNKGHNKECVKSCKKALKNPKDFRSLISGLAQKCGEMRITTPLYKCLLRVSTKIPEIHPDPNPSGRSTHLKSVVYPSFKTQCCNRAKSLECRRWCRETISSPNMMGLWGTMYLSCIQDPQEVELSNCMTDILEPCEIGVKEPMNFCTNFNERSMDLFRRGDRFGDSSARKLHKFWSDGVVTVLDYSLTFKDISQCKPELFKAMACLLAVKPCDHRHPQIQVCRSDCEELLLECLNHEASARYYEEATGNKYTDAAVQEVCAAILPNNNQTQCISLQDYAKSKRPSLNVGQTVKRHEVTLPCETNPCADDEVCLVNQDCPAHQDNSVFPCEKYKCVKGCPVSDMSKLIIPVGQLAKLSTERSEEGCYQVCECQFNRESSPIALFGNCKEFGCNKKTNCTIRNNIYRDGQVFRDQCNTCTCTDGTLDCTNKNCNFLQSNGRPRRHHDTNELVTQLAPCSCHRFYKPVCALNGMTYPNACLAKCCNIGDKELNVGDCQAVDPCDPDPCRPGYVCIPNRYVCLSPWTHCPQYTCSATRKALRYFNTHPLCSKNGNEKGEGEICGFNGVTYKNRCEAEQAGTGVDYTGACLPRALQNSDGDHDRCKSVVCTPFDNDSCDVVIPPGSCCPKCGSMLRLLYSKKDVERHQKFISSDPIAVKDVVKYMRQLLKVAECKLHGHLTVENDLLIIIMVDSQKPTRDQIYACKTEAERFHKYVVHKSPLVQTSYYLSLLKASKLKSTSWKTGSSSSTLTFKSYKDFTLVLLCVLTSILFAGGKR